MSVKNVAYGLIAATALAGVAASAQAGTVTYSTAVQPLTRTNFSTALPIQKFDSSLGTLLSVMLSLTGNVNGTAKAENEDDSPADVTLKVGASLAYKRPDGTNLVVALPSISETVTLSAYDGTDDFAGTSGVSYAASNSDTANATFTDASTLALFTGSGTLAALLGGTGTSAISGGGNLLATTSTRAGGQATVVYTFADAVVPEPASWAMMVAGFGLMGVAMRRRKTVGQFA